MKLAKIKVALAAVWVLAVCIAGVMANVTSTSSWAVLAGLAGLAVLPPLVMMWWWTPPPQSMSESIQEALK